MFQFDIITIFPDIFENYFNTSIIKRAQDKKLIKIKIHDLRRWTVDKHQTVDDRPYGGGPGMILKVGPIYKALKHIKRTRRLNKNKQRVVLLTPQGKPFNQKLARSFSKLNQLILICGRYEGVDARVDKLVDEKISVGNYVLTGGELPAMILVDAVARLAPGVIKQESLQEESFGTSGMTVEYPQYTRPEAFTYKDKSGRIKKLKVPKILRSGNHQEIKKWQKEH